MNRALTNLLRGTSGRHWLVALPIFLIISYYYAFLASAGWFKDLPNQLDYYDRMAEGFRAGHLYIMQSPSPALLAKADPYAEENFYEDLWLWDASLYKGRYYMYWGPVPGLLLLAYKVVTGHEGVVTDQWPTLVFTFGRFVGGALLILGLARIARMRQPAWVVGLAVAVFGLAAPAPFIVARPHIYEGSLAGGQCFLFLGLLACFHGLIRPKRRTVLFVLAGTLWGLAFGCRATMLIPAVLLVPITAGVIWLRLDRSMRQLIINGLSLGIPVAVAIGAYGIYNYVRFDSPTEFGVNYQVTLQKFTGDNRYIIPNVFSYLFAPVKWSCSFPFVTGLRYRPLSHLITWPSGYQTFELVAGVMVMASWCWLTLVAGWRLIASLCKCTFYASPPRHSNFCASELWALLCSLAVLLSMIPVLKLWEASMRYVGDALGGMVLASTVTAFWLLRHPRINIRWPGRFTVRAMLIAMALHTCFVGAFSAIASYNDPLKHLNPILFESLRRSLSLCGLF